MMKLCHVIALHFRFNEIVRTPHDDSNTLPILFYQVSNFFILASFFRARLNDTRSDECLARRMISNNLFFS